MSSEHDVVVIGAGAAGLWVAEVAGRGGARVLVLEKTTRVGTKVLASGGSRCNLTTTLEAGQAARLFGSRGERFLRAALSALPPRQVRARFAAWGVPTTEAPLEKVFPTSQRARDVCDALEHAARAAGAEVALEAAVTGLTPEGDGWRVHLGDGREVRASRVVLAAGGSSFPSTGTTGEGYDWLRALDLPVVEPRPALAPLTSPASWVHDLAGLSLQEAQVRLTDGEGRVLARRTRPLLFTHRGVSGPAAMDVSTHLPQPALGCELRVDLVPTQDREQLRAALVQAAAAPGNPRLARVLAQVPRRLLAVVARQAEVEPNPIVARLRKDERHALIEVLKGLRIPIDGTEGWDKAEVTAGGLDLRALNPRTMEVNAHPGLFVVGELLDLDGPIGGLSFLAAFATAELAGLELARRAGG
jgi:predicted Rossmann fold flavoprotein